MFANECVGRLGYESTAPAIAMASAVITFLLDFIGRRYARRSEDGTATQTPPTVPSGKEERASPTETPRQHHHDHHNFDATLAAERSWQTLLLEAGIIFHSIMIGVTLVSLCLSQLQPN